MSKGIPLPVVLNAGLIRRFWTKVQITPGCWDWTAARSHAGYGRIAAGLPGIVYPAHRVSLAIDGLEIPADRFVDHRCFNKACVNPDHLRLVTKNENGEHRTGPQVNSTTGVRGVSRHPAGKYQVNATTAQRQVYGGLYVTLEEAERAAKDLRIALFTHNDVDRLVRGVLPQA